jgi:hypothetical protein
MSTQQKLFSLEASPCKTTTPHLTRINLLPAFPHSSPHTQFSLTSTLSQHQTPLYRTSAPAPPPPPPPTKMCTGYYAFFIGCQHQWVDPSVPDERCENAQRLGLQKRECEDFGWVRKYKICGECPPCCRLYYESANV